MRLPVQLVESFDDAQLNFEVLQGLPPLRGSGTFAANKAVAAALGSGAAAAKVAIDTVDFDVAGWFNTTTHRFMPQLAGYYCFFGFVSGASAGLADGDLVQLQIRKNGSLIATPPGAGVSDLQSASASIFGADLDVTTGPISMNGSTDYVELWGLCITSGGGQVATTFSALSLSGFLVAAI